MFSLSKKIHSCKDRLPMCCITFKKYSACLESTVTLIENSCKKECFSTAILFIINAQRGEIFQKGGHLFRGKIFSTKTTKKCEFSCKKLNKVDTNIGF